MRVADATHDLHGVVDDLEGGLPGIALDERGVDLDGLAVHLLPCGLVQHVLHVLDLDLHIDDLFLDQLKRPDGLAELLAHPRILHGLVVGATGHAHVGGADGQALDLEVLHQLVEALALDADDIGLFALDVVEVDFVGAAHVVADLVELLDGDARAVHREQVHAEVFIGVLVDAAAADAEHERSAVGARVERLVAVDVHLAVAFGRRRGHGGAIGARLGLGEPEREGLDALKRVIEDGLLLLFVAEGQDVVDLGSEVDPDKRRVAEGMGLFGNHDLGEDIGGSASELLGNAERREARFDERVDGLLGVFVVLVAFLEVVLEITPLHNRSEAFEQKFLLLGFLEVHRVLLFVSSADCQTIFT